jgi:hypothetical protein
MERNNWKRNKYYVAAFKLTSQKTLPDNTLEVLANIQKELTADTKRNIQDYSGTEYIDAQQAISNMNERVSRRLDKF